MLYALDAVGPSLLWKRPLNGDETIIGIDTKRAYILGHDLSAMDLATRQLVWSIPMPTETGDMHAIQMKDRIYVLTSRGIYEIDAATGDRLRVFRGMDRGAAGRLEVARDKLLCVTPTAITAYPLGGAAAQPGS